ncbi:MAG: flagellar motor switch protein FliN [Deltaproteobacteria bacterium]|jgi:flagellar motor switch protein FliN/FliY|nr:flagellar motor switch protein FliN [Deltaproteobacteria bacterium]MCW8894049.1 flagellar motor switch protein FliN [Deltaproteobacteria bacterium]MCW9050669.1 flagellar motor switch protein FliN [Deltaproteobacteria bacterium]
MSDVNVENGKTTDVATSASRLEGRGLDLLLDIPLEVAVEVGRSRILVRDLLQLQEGSLVELDKLAGEPLDLYVNSRLIARGEAVVVNEKFGLRLTDVVSPSERIEKLG